MKAVRIKCCKKSLFKRFCLKLHHRKSIYFQLWELFHSTISLDFFSTKHFSSFPNPIYVDFSPPCPLNCHTAGFSMLRELYQSIIIVYILLLASYLCMSVCWCYCDDWACECVSVLMFGFCSSELSRANLQLRRSTNTLLQNMQFTLLPLLLLLLLLGSILAFKTNTICTCTSEFNAIFTNILADFFSVWFVPYIYVFENTYKNKIKDSKWLLHFYHCQNQNAMERGEGVSERRSWQTESREISMEFQMKKSEKTNRTACDVLASALIIQFWW